MILGFAGKAASGKTTAAKHLAPLLDGETRIIPMAMLLRDEVESFLRAVGAEQSVPLVYGCQEDKKKHFYVEQAAALAECPELRRFMADHADIQDRPGQIAMTVRRILQWWGTEYRRAEDPDYWTKAWERKVGQLDLEHLHVLVDDVRFVNELDSLTRLGGMIVKIDRPGYAAGGNHASETALDDFTDWQRVIVNNASLDAFKTSVEELVELQKNN